MRIDAMERGVKGFLRVMPDPGKPESKPLVARRSKSAAASRLGELRRLREMTVEQRIHAALTMSRRFSWLKPTSGK
jgi:hypothetical protein